MRKSLAGAIGYFNEQCGAEVLSHLLTDGDAAVSQAARASLEMLARPGMEPPRPGETYSSSEWAALLRELSEFRLTDPELAARLSDPVLRGNWRGNWLGEPGATAPEIIALERRIGQALPPSYRSFLAESDGFLSPDIFIPALHGTKEADWFGVRHAEWAQAYRDTYPHLGSYLQVSSAGDGAVVLLNPNVKASDGEWQTCFFANWIPGARVHASF
ncbi:MAG TPA: SMI1/KNR4 family protein, partial [Candidatus Sulfopaludibacter sp.]|nr:SMI1/KNR4 family protein [Candidatus Sulfopaludibacter sp.]